MANITSAGTGNSNAGATWTGGSVPTSSDNAIIQNGHTVTQNAAHTFKSLKVESGGAWTADGSNHLTLSGEDDSDFAFAIDGTYNHTNGTVVINNGGGGIAHAAIRAGDATSTTGLYDLTISGGGTTCEIYNSTTIHRNMEAGGSTTVLRGALTVNGNLTVQGTLTTIFSSTSHNLTVTGTTDVTGTLTCNASTISLGSGKSDDYALKGSGTVNFGTGTNTVGAVQTTSASGITKTSGTITFNTTKTGGQSIGPNVSNVNSHFNFGTSTVNFDLSGGFGTLFGIEQHVGSSKTFTITAATVNFKSNGRIYQNNSDTNIVKIIGDLVIDASKTLTTYFDNADDFGSKLEVTGDVTLNGTLNAYSASNPKPMDFGSLVIAGGGTYSATSGTTTITNEKSGHAWKNNGGTFTHNNGKVLIDFDTGNLAQSTEVKENTFYDLEVKLDQAGYELRLEDHSSTNAMDILNNLTVTKGIFDTSTKSDTLTIHGQTIIESDGVFTEADHDTNKIIHNGIVRNSGTYKINNGTTVKMNGGIRNLGTITVA